MNANDLIHSINARALLFGAAIAMAVAAAATISVTGDEHGIASKHAANVEVVRLEPVAVTISPERFDAIRAESQTPSVIARARGANKTAPRV